MCECEVYIEEINIGNEKAIKSYGAFYHDELISSLSFGKANDGVFHWKVTNEFGDENYFGLLFEKFINSVSVRSCISYDSKYEQYGFKKVGDYYSYFPQGIVYKITDLDTGKFYIGSTFRVDLFEANKYNGSGGVWKKYYNEFKDKHRFERKILKDNFNTPKEMYDYEVKEIRKHCIELGNGNYKVDDSTGCMNRKTVSQPEAAICPKCGGINFHHRKGCPDFIEKPCPKCGKIYGPHYKGCPDYKEQEPCPECKGKDGHHRKGCSKFRVIEDCPECGGKDGKHWNTCSRFTPRVYKVSQEVFECCGNRVISYTHKPWCVNFVDKGYYECCGKKAKGHHHAKWCVNYKHIEEIKEVCIECKEVNGKHKASCSHHHSKQKCKFCGYSLQSHRHAKDCPLYKEDKKCPHCGSTRRHLKDCPFYKEVVCEECEGKNGYHKEYCSKYKLRKKKKEEINI